MMMSEELKPCPFCGSYDVVMEETYTSGYARCRGCGVEGGMRDSCTEAAAAWNRRAIDVDALCEVVDELECALRPKDYTSVDVLCELSNDASKALAKRIREAVGL